MKITPDLLIQNLASSGLLSADEIASLKEQLGETGKVGDAETLVRTLVESGKLTEYQAEVVCQGKTDALVFGEYTVLDRIGAGGMGEVYRARHRRMKRLVAIKILPQAAMAAEDAVERFYQEVEAAAKLGHANVVTAYDASEHGGIHYLVMEYVDGRDLASVVNSDGPLPVDQAADVILQAARGLEYAHGEGIIHRDIKPANLLLDKKGTVKILDMGLARIEHGAGDREDGEGLTKSGQIMGTSDYIPPEQAMDPRKASARSDIYSLGCTLYRLLTDKTPYTGETVMLKIMAHMNQPIPSLREARPDVPAPLEALYRQMMAKKPEDRPRTMSEVVAALEEIIRGSTTDEDSAPTGRPEDSQLTDFFDQMRDGPAATAVAGRRGEKPAATGTAAPVKEKTAPASEETVDQVPCDNTSRSEVAGELPLTAPATAPTLVSERRRPAARRQKKLPLLMIGIGVAISLIGAAVAGVILYVQTNYGTIVVDARDEDIQVSVKSGNDEAYAVDARNQWRIEAKAGKYHVEIKGGHDRLKLDKDTVTVARGGELRVSVERKPRQVAGPAKTSPESAVGPISASKGIAEYCRRLRDAWVERDFSPSRNLHWPDGWVFAGPDEQSQELIVTGSSESLETFLATVDEVVPLTDPPVYEVQGPLAVVSWKKVRLRGDGWSHTMDGVDIVAQHDGEWRFVFGISGDWRMTSEDRYDPDNSDHVALQALLDRVGDAVERKDAKVLRGVLHPDNCSISVGPNGPQVGGVSDFTDEIFRAPSTEKHRHTITSIKVLGPLAITLSQLDQMIDGQPVREQGNLNIYGRTKDGWRVLAWVAGDWNNVFLTRSDTSRLEPTWSDLLPPEAPEPAIAPFKSDEAKEHQQAWADYLGLPVERDHDLPGGEKLTLLLIPPGEFLMGSREAERQWALEGADIENITPGVQNVLSEGPQHRVRLTQPFYLGMHEVTQAQWEAVMGNNPSYTKDTASHPVEQVSWNDIQQFLKKVNESDEKQGMKLVLPTEAQWEYACRAGTTTFWHCGDSDDILREYAWFIANSGEKTHPVGQLCPNGFGLYDMHGNVREWCADWFFPEYYKHSPVWGSHNSSVIVPAVGPPPSPPTRSRSKRNTSPPPARTDG